MTERETLKAIREGILSGKCSDGNLAWIVNLCDESLSESESANAGNAAAMREALDWINRINTGWLKRLLVELVEADIFDGGLINKTISAVEKVRAALSAPARNQEVLASPIDLNERFIHIGDSVHMLNTRDDGDHEWDDVVLSLEYVGKSGGDDWLVHGEDGAAWACECEVLNRKGEGDGK